MSEEMKIVLSDPDFSASKQIKEIIEFKDKEGVKNRLLFYISNQTNKYYILLERFDSNGSKNYLSTQDLNNLDFEFDSPSLQGFINSVKILEDQERTKILAEQEALKAALNETSDLKSSKKIKM
jgi:hypothetical protein